MCSLYLLPTLLHPIFSSERRNPAMSFEEKNYEGIERHKSYNSCSAAVTARKPSSRKSCQKIIHLP